MGDIDSNEAYPYAKRGGLDRFKERLEIALEAKSKLQRKMDEVDLEIRDLNDRIFELEDGRLLRAIKNLLQSGSDPVIQGLIDHELEKIGYGELAKPGKKPKPVKLPKATKAPKVPKVQKVAATSKAGDGDSGIPVNPSPIAMPTAKSLSGRL